MLPRLKRLRTTAFSVALMGILAAPAFAGNVPKLQWTPGGPVSYGDPDVGNGGIQLLRMTQHLLLWSLRCLTNPVAPTVEMPVSTTNLRQLP